MDWTLIMPWLLPVLAVLVAPVGGAILMGLDRKITARMQGRIGPPIRQPFYDVFKLLAKNPLALNSIQIMYAYLHLALMILVVVLLAMGQDMLMILFVHAFAGIALILGGMCVRSPYSRIGAQRKIMQLLAYEPILILMVVGIYMTNNSFMAWKVVKMDHPLLISLPLMFVAFLCAVLIKLDKSPFDVATSHHAHQELIKGVTLEYSGPYLAIIEIAHFYEAFILFAIIAMFWWSANPFIAVAIAAGCFLLQAIVDNAFARLTTMWMVRYMWTVPMILAIGNIIWLYMGTD